MVLQGAARRLFFLSANLILYFCEGWITGGFGFLDDLAPSYRKLPVGVISRGPSFLLALYLKNFTRQQEMLSPHLN